MEVTVRTPLLKRILGAGICHLHYSYSHAKIWSMLLYNEFSKTLLCEQSQGHLIDIIDGKRGQLILSYYNTNLLQVSNW